MPKVDWVHLVIGVSFILAGSLILYRFVIKPATEGR